MRLGLFILALSTLSCHAQAALDGSALSTVPILHTGRVKPLDTFARTNLLMVYGKRSLPTMDAMAWLTELMFEPEKAYERKVFRLQNPKVVEALGMEPSDDMLYAFRELSNALKKQFETIRVLYNTKEEERTPDQNQLVNLYMATMTYYDISRSLTLLFPDIFITSEDLAEKLKLPYESGTSFLDFHPRSHMLGELIKNLARKKKKPFSKKDQAFISLLHASESIQQDAHAQMLRIIAPQFQHTNEWISPWMVLNMGSSSASSLAYLDAWKNLVVAYRAQDPRAWQETAANITQMGQTAPGNTVRASILRLEHTYNKLDIFTKSLAFYILAFLLLATGLLARPVLFRRLALTSVGVGALLHITGLAMRIFIMGRPPVSTLYESIIFVGAIVVLSGLVLEYFRRSAVGTFISACAGALLHLIALGYSADGDTMGMLVAVLNSNFWLTTHVLAITIGYGCCVVAGMLGHIYVAQRILIKRKNASHTDNTSHKHLAGNMSGAALVALLFTLVGTILGGIWADQSWGRFWGWDPKENGALLIVLWLFMLLHGKIGGLLSPLGFATGLIITNIVVALAWFGVNLLNVGLHSYGFTNNVATNLFLFCGAELLIAIVGYQFAKPKRMKKGA